MESLSHCNHRESMKGKGKRECAFFLTAVWEYGGGNSDYSRLVLARKWNPCPGKVQGEISTRKLCILYFSSSSECQGN